MAATATTAPAPIPAAEAELPFAGYDRLGERELIHGLSDHTQSELDAVDGYERSHKSREAVLNKLRYLRGREPLPGYDALDAEKILAAVASADLATLKRVRGYERKFRNRPQVLDEVIRLQRARREAQPASAVPAYQPLSATSGASGGGAKGRDGP